MKKLELKIFSTEFLSERDSKRLQWPFHFFFEDKKLVDVFYTNDIEESNIIYLSGLDSVDIDNEFYKSLDIAKNKIGTNDITNKLILFFFIHETHRHHILEKKIKLISSFLNVDESKILCIQSSLFDFGRIKVPLQFKLKQYKFEFYNNFDFDFKFRNFKLTFLNNKIREFRLKVLDSIFKIYKNDIQKIKNENLISFGNLNFLINRASLFLEKNYNSFEYYENLDFPWILDEHKINIKAHSPAYNTAINFYKQSIFSIITETETGSGGYLSKIYDLFEKKNKEEYYTTLQISEKILLPLIAGSLPILIMDSFYYEKLEKLGFDFSYIKDLFNINYKEIDFKDFYNKFESIILPFIQNSNLKDLNEILLKYKTTIIKNKEISLNILYGEFDNEEMNFLKQII